MAQITIARRTKFLGHYTDKQDAIDARVVAEKELYKQWGWEYPDNKVNNKEKELTGSI